MIPKALRSGADMVCIDLEDAIIPEHKDISRVSTVKAFENISVPYGVETLIRINDVNSEEGKEDIQAILNSNNTASGLMLPMGWFKYTGGTGKHEGISGDAGYFIGYTVTNWADGSAGGYATWNK